MDWLAELHKDMDAPYKPDWGIDWEAVDEYLNDEPNEEDDSCDRYRFPDPTA